MKNYKLHYTEPSGRPVNGATQRQSDSVNISRQRVVTALHHFRAAIQLQTENKNNDLSSEMATAGYSIKVPSV